MDRPFRAQSGLWTGTQGVALGARNAPLGLNTTAHPYCTGRHFLRPGHNIGLRSDAPKGHNPLAQGNALGTGPRPRIAGCMPATNALLQRSIPDVTTQVTTQVHKMHLSWYVPHYLSDRTWRSPAAGGRVRHGRRGSPVGCNCLVGLRLGSQSELRQFLLEVIELAKFPQRIVSPLHSPTSLCRPDPVSSCVFA